MSFRFYGDGEIQGHSSQDEGKRARINSVSYIWLVGRTFDSKEYGDLTSIVI